MIKNKSSEKVFIDALPCETIVTDRAGKIFRANRNHCKAKIFPHDKKLFQGTRNKEQGIRNKEQV